MYNCINKNKLIMKDFIEKTEKKKECGIDGVIENTETIIKIDNSTQFKDFDISQKRFFEGAGTKEEIKFKNVCMTLDTEEKILKIGRVKMEETDIRLLINFLNQI